MAKAIQRIYTAEFRTEMTSESRLRGHAAVFHRLAPIGQGYEQIGEHAFDEVLKRDADVRLLLNHNPDNLLGRTSSGTLALNVDKGGLIFDGDLPDTTLGNDVKVLIKRNDLTGFSFGFIPDLQSDTFGKAPDGKRIITRNNVINLLDVSLATYPAYKDTDGTAVLRAMDFTAIKTDRKSQLIRMRFRALQKGQVCVP